MQTYTDANAVRALEHSACRVEIKRHEESGNKTNTNVCPPHMCATSHHFTGEEPAAPIFAVLRSLIVPAFVLLMLFLGRHDATTPAPPLGPRITVSATGD